MTRSIISSIAVMFVLFSATLSFAQDQAKIDDNLLTEYFAKNKIKATKTASGLYYVIHKKGSGDNAKPGQSVTMNYIGKFMDGKRFDGNVDDNFAPAAGRQPFTFTLGRGMVIRGWDEGVALLNKGTRATLYLPSGISYGPSGRGPIPPNSVLVFDVEVLSIN